MFPDQKYKKKSIMHQQFDGEGKIDSSAYHSVLSCPISSWKVLEHSQQDSHEGHRIPREILQFRLSEAATMS